MTDETKAAAAEAASENSANDTATPKKDDQAATSKKDTKTAKKDAPAEKAAAPEKKAKKFNNPFSNNDPLQAKLVNCIMKNGKKTVARRILQDCFEEMNRRGEKDVMKTFEKAIQNATPTMEVRPKRVGGSVYQIPIEVKPKRQQSLSLRWLLTSARARKGQPMYKRLASELMDCANEQGAAYNKKVEAHRAAQANKAFAHLARY